MNKMGISLKKVDEDKTKPVTDILHSTAKWHNTFSNNISKKRIFTPKHDSTKNPIAPKEYLLIN